MPVKGQHNVRYYDLYVPGARPARDAVLEQLAMPVGEAVSLAEKPERPCPVCGAPLRHYRSARREISYIKNTRPHDTHGGGVQQAVGADRIGLEWSPPTRSAVNFLPGRRRLN